MFAVPDLTVYTPLRSAPTVAPPSLTALVRTVGALHRPVAGPVPADDPRVRVWLSLLAPGQLATATYDATQGAFAVLDGTVLERSGNHPERPLRPGQVRVFGPGYRHEVRNTGSRPVHAVHIQIRL